MTIAVKKLLFLVFLCLSLNMYGEKALLIGIFKNAPMNDRIELKVAHYYIDGHAETHRALIKNGQFSIEADLIEPQYVTLSYKTGYKILYLEPNDTLIVESDIFQFPRSVKFSGKGGYNNELLSQFLAENPINFNEFSKLRYKINNHWSTVDREIDQAMNRMKPDAFMAFLDEKMSAQLAFMDAYILANPNKTSATFRDFLTAEVLYTRALRILIYGNVYKVMHDIDPAFFEALYEVSTHCDAVGSPAYRRYILALFAHKSKVERTNDDFSYQYLTSADLLSGSSLAFFRSEIICNALKEERYTDALPFYTSFLKNNTVEHYEEKVTSLYQKALKISPGTPAPSFSGQTYAGDYISLSAMRGKIVYLNFWASYCTPCIKKMNYFNRHFQELNDAGIEIINVSIDKNIETWQGSVARLGMRGKNLQTLYETDKNIAEAYGVVAVPQYFILGRDGTFESKPVSIKPKAIKARLLELSN